MSEPRRMGILSALFAKGRKAFSFEYDPGWLTTKGLWPLDPDIQFFSGPQYPYGKQNFGLFMDSMPDSWGKTLMRRRELQRAKESGERARTLYEIDYLLGVYDQSRMGGLRFKTDPDGPFLDDSSLYPTPPWSSIGGLQEAADKLEQDERHKDVDRWLNLLVAPGSSLGGARPKANIIDKDQNLWIAKFPSKNDTIDIAAWEYLAYLLAVEAGIRMAPSKIEKIRGEHHTFFTRRFDRSRRERVHFSSAMTMTGNTEDSTRDHPASYLEIAEFIQNKGTEINRNLEQLWRRIVFSIAISNTDDHLRNHGFILTSSGWVLSPAYDINPSIEDDGLSLNIDMDHNVLDFDLAMSVGEYFRLDRPKMKTILEQVNASVRQWRNLAGKIGISPREQELMAGAFRMDIRGSFD